HRMPIYRIPDRTVLSYVAFELTNYFKQADENMSTHASNVTAFVNEAFVKRDTNELIRTADGKVDEAATKAKIKEEIREREAYREAHKAAAQFGSDLLDKVGKAQPTIQAFTN